MITRSRVALALLLAILIASSIQLSDSKSESHLFVSKVSASSVDNVVVYFLDVGQGDSILIKMENKSILIDGGPKTASTTLLGFLSSVNVTHLNFIIATHPHEDHIGGLVAVMQSIAVDSILYNGYNYTTQIFQDFMTLALVHNLTIASRNQVYQLTTTTNFTILNPIQPLEFSDINANSVVIKLQVNNVSFLFTGDATIDSEQSMLNAGLNLQSDVLKVGHHGSNTSTSQAFLDTVNPSYAVISAGINNTYGHPHDETIQKLVNKGVTIYGTFASGTIVFSTDGNLLTVQGNPQNIPEFALTVLPILMLSMLAVSVVLKKRKFNVIR